MFTNLIYKSWDFNESNINIYILFSIRFFKLIYLLAFLKKDRNYIIYIGLKVLVQK